MLDASEVTEFLLHGDAALDIWIEMLVGVPIGLQLALLLTTHSVTLPESPVDGGSADK